MMQREASRACSKPSDANDEHDGPLIAPMFRHPVVPCATMMGARNGKKLEQLAKASRGARMSS